MNEDTYRKLVKTILSFSNFPDCAVSIRETEQAQVRFANNGLTTSGLTRERTVFISSTKDAQTGSVATTEIDEASLKAAVARSEELASISPPNPEYMEPLGGQEWPSMPAPDPDTLSARTTVMAPHIHAIIEAAQAKKLVAAGFFARTTTRAVIANKKGLFGVHLDTDSSLSTTIRNPEGTSSGWASQPSSRISEINGALIAAAAVEKCLNWKKPKRLEPGNYTVILEPTAVGDLCGRMGFAMNARAAEEGRSFLSKKGGGTLLGEKLFPETITLVSDPFDPRNPGLPWSGNWMPNAKTTWIDKGVVKNLAYDRYWAAKVEKKPTPTPGSLRLEGGTKSVGELIAAVERGLLVTRFWYIRSVNPQTMQLTGLTRDGLFLVENGKVTDPVMNFRFNESPIRMLQNVRALGPAIRVQGGESGMIAPALVADNFTFSSVSDAV